MTHLALDSTGLAKCRLHTASIQMDTGLRVHIQHQTWDSNDIFPFSIAKKGDSNDIEGKEVRWYRYDIDMI